MPGLELRQRFFAIFNATLAAAAARARVRARGLGIDARTTYGSSDFVRSPLTGDWESYVQDVVAEIDRRYRTRATTDGRAVIGHSTGGFNAISVAMRHPTLFGAVAASSPDALDLEAWLLTEDGRHARSLWRSWMRFEDRLGPPGQFASYAASRCS